jgi:hypothetical protein
MCPTRIRCASGRQLIIADCVVALALLGMSFVYGGVGAALP